MRSKKAELEDVVKQFEAWRAKPHGRLIPEELWKAALGLLESVCAEHDLQSSPSQCGAIQTGPREWRGRCGREAFQGARANGCYGSVPAHSTGSERGGAGHGVSSKWQRVRRAAAVRHGLRGRHDDTAARRGSAWSEQMPSDGGERSGEPHGRDGERRG